MARVLFFGATADIAGTRELQRSATDSSELLSDLLVEFPSLASHKLLIAVNQEYAHEPTTLREDDEVAVFTVVSGG